MLLKFDPIYIFAPRVKRQILQTSAANEYLVLSCKVKFVPLSRIFPYSKLNWLEAFSYGHFFASSTVFLPVRSAWFEGEITTERASVDVRKILYESSFHGILNWIFARTAGILQYNSARYFHLRVESVHYHGDRKLELRTFMKFEAKLSFLIYKGNEIGRVRFSWKMYSW